MNLVILTNSCILSKLNFNIADYVNEHATCTCNILDKQELNHLAVLLPLTPP